MSNLIRCIHLRNNYPKYYLGLEINEGQYVEQNEDKTIFISLSLKLDREETISLIGILLDTLK